MIGKEYFMQRKTPIIIVLLVLIVGSLTYFTTGVAEKSEGMTTSNSVTSNKDLSLFKDIQLKAGYSEDGKIDIFALAKNNNIAKYRAMLGNPIPESDSVVLGSDEGNMMLKEGEFKKVGDIIEDYNLKLKVEGLLEKTGTFADDFHFLNSEEYNKLDGDSTVLSVQFKDANTPKLFYIYNKDKPSEAKIELADGNMNLFYNHIINNKVYYPIIIGAKEAKMMQEEKLFSKTGDVINGFFGKNVIIVGITTETNTGMDMMYIVAPDFFEKPLEPVKGVLL